MTEGILINDSEPMYIVYYSEVGFSIQNKGLATWVFYLYRSEGKEETVLVMVSDMCFSTHGTACRR